MKPKAAAVSSAIIWGSGQFVNKQRIKGLMFFALQVIFISIDLFSGTLDALTSGDFQYRNAGFFVKGFWGLITLGEIPRATTNTAVYDHSIMLLISGLIALMVFLIFMFIYVWNIKDSYKVAKDYENGISLTTKEYFAQLWEDSFEYIMITPALILILFISVVPIMFAFLTSFTNYNSANIPPKNLVNWVGLQTYRDVFAIKIWGYTFVNVFKWNVVWAVLSTFTTFAMGFFQAILVNNKFIKGKKIWRGIYILPWAIPAFLSSMMFRTMLSVNGPFNAMLINLGLIHKPLPFLSDTMWARTCIILVNLWLGFPYYMALISGMLGTISEELYEAASIDGANALHKFKAITFPQVMQAIAPLIVFSFTFNFNNFGIVYFLTEGGPANSSYQMAGNTDILISWIFKLTLTYRMYNYASVFSIFIFIIMATISVFNLLRTKAFKED